MTIQQSFNRIAGAGLQLANYLTEEEKPTENDSDGLDPLQLTQPAPAPEAKTAGALENNTPSTDTQSADALTAEQSRAETAALADYTQKVETYRAQTDAFKQRVIYLKEKGGVMPYHYNEKGVLTRGGN